MSVSYDLTTQNARMDATLARIDNHALPATLEICTAAFGSVLAILTLSDPSFSRAGSPATLTLLGVPKSTLGIAAGVAALARIKDGGGAVIVNNLSVATGGADINLNATTISVGQTVTITAGTITHAP